MYPVNFTVTVVLLTHVLSNIVKIISDNFLETRNRMVQTNIKINEKRSLHLVTSGLGFVALLYDLARVEFSVKKIRAAR
jgi:hypothetical protein